MNEDESKLIIDFSLKCYTQTSAVQIATMITVYDVLSVSLAAENNTCLAGCSSLCVVNYIY